MAELDTIVSVIGTLAGIVLGYWISLGVESRRQKYEKEMAYRQTLLNHTDDLIKPLFAHIEAVWGDIAVLETSMRSGSPIMKGKTMEDLLRTTDSAFQDLKTFIHDKYTEMSFLMPHELSPWVFAPIYELIANKVLEPFSRGEKPAKEMTLAINVLMKYQRNLRKLLGFETEVKIDSIYPFKDNEQSK